MTWLSLYFALQIGLSVNSGIVTYNPTDLALSPQSGYVQMASELRFLDNTLFVGGDIRTEIQAESWNNYMPELSSYGFKAGLRFKGLEIGLLAQCQHPTLPYYSDYHPLINYDGWYRELYVSFTGESKLF